MSRNPEYQFVSTDPVALVDRLITEYETISGMAIRPASPERLMIQWAAAVLLLERAQENYAINQNIPSRAEGENLDALAELFFARKRTPAQSAVCTMRFHISEPQQSAVLIPAGTRVTDESQTLYWETEADAYVPVGAEYLDLEARCQTEGTAGNGWAAGQISTLVDIYDYYSTCENITTSDGGADEMTDDELYEAMRLSMDALSTAGARGSYVYHAKAVSTEIADVAVSTPAPGEIRIFALMKDGKPAGETMKAKIYEACNADTVRPLTDHVLMQDPEAVNFNVDLTYYLPQGSSPGNEGIDEKVQQAVEEYISWQEGKLGRDINPSKLISLIMATGVKRVDVKEPVFTRLRDGQMPLRGIENPEAYSVPQIASVQSVAVNNGGVEDE